MIYFAMFLVSIFFAMSACYFKHGNGIIEYKICSVLSFIPPFLVSGLRSFNIGTDTSATYLNIYKLALYSKSLTQIRETGYFLLNKIAILFFNNYTGVLIITSLIMCGFAYYGIFKLSKYPVMSVILFFITNVYFISMNMVRQSIATAIFVFAIQYIKNKKPIRYFLCILIASSIHVTALLYIPIYFLSKVRIRIKYIVMILLVGLIFAATFTGIIQNFIYSKIFCVVL